MVHPNNNDNYDLVFMQFERYTGLFGGTGFQGGSFLGSVFLHVEVSVILVMVFFEIATWFLEHFVLRGVVWRSREILVLKGYIGYYVHLVFQSQYVA